MDLILDPNLAAAEALAPELCLLVRTAAELGHGVHATPDVAPEALAAVEGGRPSRARSRRRRGEALHPLLASLTVGGMDFAVTEDAEVRSAARGHGLAHRVVTVAEAVYMLLELAERSPDPLPVAHRMRLQDLRSREPILMSLREAEPEIGTWLRECRQRQSLLWVTEGGSGEIAALCAADEVDDEVESTTRTALELTAMYACPGYPAARHSEALLKAVFAHAETCEAEQLLASGRAAVGWSAEFLEEFGFSEDAVGDRLAKPLHPRSDDVVPWTPLEYHARFGPRYFRGAGVDWYTVPVAAGEAARLFPERAAQLSLFTGHYVGGNPLRKAVICPSRGQVPVPGSVLLFYRPEDGGGGIALGIVEQSFASADALEIARAVAKRTIYSWGDIQRRCTRTVTAVLFREAALLTPPLSRRELAANGVFARVPSSLRPVEAAGREWLQARMQEPD